MHSEEFSECRESNVGAIKAGALVHRAHTGINQLVNKRQPSTDALGEWRPVKRKQRSNGCVQGSDDVQSRPERQQCAIKEANHAEKLPVRRASAQK